MRVVLKKNEVQIFIFFRKPKTRRVFGRTFDSDLTFMLMGSKKMKKNKR